MLLRLAESPTRVGNTLKSRTANGNFYLAIEGCPTVTVYRAGDTHPRQIHVEEGQTRGVTGDPRSALEQAEFTLPWHDATVERYHRIF
jgi:hypothetical protein